MVQHGLVTPAADAAAAGLLGAVDGLEAVAGKKAKGKKANGKLAKGGGGGGEAGGAGGSSGELTVELVGTLQGALTKFYTQKNCRLNTRLVSELLRRQPQLGWCLAPHVASHVSGARDAYLCGEACNHVATLLQQKHALGHGAAALAPHLELLTSQLLALLAREGLKAKQLLPPLKLGHALLLTLRAAAPARAPPVATALAGAVDALRVRHPDAARSLAGQCQKLEALARQLNGETPVPNGGGGGGGGGGKKAHKKAKLQHQES